jgi:protein KTI12
VETTSKDIDMNCFVLPKQQGKNFISDQNETDDSKIHLYFRITQATVNVASTKEQSWTFNENRDDKSEIYTKQMFDALWMRYEEPISTNRWDSPLFFVMPEDKLNFEELYNSLYEKKPPSANQSTQNPPTQSTNYLFELDRITQEIVNEINSARKLGSIDPVKIKNSTDPVMISPDVPSSQLNRLRRQYLNYSKNHLDTAGDLTKAPSLFVQYLNSFLSE